MLFSDFSISETKRNAIHTRRANKIEQTYIQSHQMELLVFFRVFEGSHYLIIAYCGDSGFNCV